MRKDTGPICAIAFDLDGLMFNTEEIYVEVARELLRRRGQPLNMRVIQLMMGRPARVALPIMIESHHLSDDVETLEAETQEIFDELLPQTLAPLPGLMELIDLLDALQFPKAIATSSRRRYVDRILALAQLPTQFDFFLTAEDVEHGKPNPEIYLRAAQRFGIPPSAMMVLEDSEYGCQAAVAAGAVTVVVPGKHNAHAKYVDGARLAESLIDPWILERLPAKRRI